MKAIKKIVVIGATGLVGSTVLRYLAAKAWPASDLYVVASARSAGKTIDYRGEKLTVIAIDQFDFGQSDLAFFAAGSAISREYAPQAVTKGNWVIDKSSHFRTDATIPLVIASVNFDVVDVKVPGIIAVPNCSTIPLAIILKVIHDRYGLKRVEVATYQAVSGAGLAGVVELEAQLTAYPKALAAQQFSHPILNNVIASIDAMSETGYTLEELKLHNESRKILNLPDLIVNATAVRVPVLYGHSEAVSIETIEPVDLPELNQLLAATQHVQLLLHPLLPNPLEHGLSDGTVWVSRVRQMPGDVRNRVNLWLLANNLSRGAALTAFEIAERLGAFNSLISC